MGHVREGDMNDHVPVARWKYGPQMISINLMGKAAIHRYRATGVIRSHSESGIQLYEIEEFAILRAYLEKADRKWEIERGSEAAHRRFPFLNREGSGSTERNHFDWATWSGRDVAERWAVLCKLP